jgi:hypothetical protein
VLEHLAVGPELMAHAGQSADDRHGFQTQSVPNSEHKWRDRGNLHAQGHVCHQQTVLSGLTSQRITSAKLTATQLVWHFFFSTLCDSRITDDLGESHPVSKNRKRPAGYYKIYRSLKELRKEQADSFDEGFSHIEQYLAALEEANPGSTTTLQFVERSTPTQEDPQHTTKSFVRLFVMLRGQAECAARCKPVISYDGAFTKVIRRAPLT